MGTSADPACANVVLVIDDDAALRHAISEILEEDDYTVVTARDGAEGLAAIDELAVDPSVVILDVRMPLFSGYDVLASLRATREHEQVPVIVITGDAAAAAELRGRGMPVLRKPFDSAELIAMVQVTAERAARSAARRWS